MKISELAWSDWSGKNDRGDVLLGCKLEGGGQITVLDRLTGYGDGDIRDTETGYRDAAGNFWCASGRFDIREFPEMSVENAIAHIKTCSSWSSPAKGPEVAP